MSGVTRWVLGRGRDGPWSGVRLLQSERVASSPGAAATSYTNWGFTVVEVFLSWFLRRDSRALRLLSPQGRICPSLLASLVGAALGIGCLHLHVTVPSVALAQTPFQEDASHAGHGTHPVPVWGFVCTGLPLRRPRFQIRSQSQF